MSALKQKEVSINKIKRLATTNEITKPLANNDNSQSNYVANIHCGRTTTNKRGRPVTSDTHLNYATSISCGTATTNKRGRSVTRNVQLNYVTNITCARITTNNRGRPVTRDTLARESSAIENTKFGWVQNKIGKGNILSYKGDSKGIFSSSIDRLRRKSLSCSARLMKFVSSEGPHPEKGRVEVHDTVLSNFLCLDQHSPPTIDDQISAVKANDVSNSTERMPIMNENETSESKVLGKKDNSDESIPNQNDNDATTSKILDVQPSNEILVQFNCKRTNGEREEENLFGRESVDKLCKDDITTSSLSTTLSTYSTTSTYSSLSSSPMKCKHDRTKRIDCKNVSYGVNKPKVTIICNESLDNRNQALQIASSFLPLAKRGRPRKKVSQMRGFNINERFDKMIEEPTLKYRVDNNDRNNDNSDHCENIRHSSNHYDDN
eukprot:Awhi_evm1s15824